MDAKHMVKVIELGLVVAKRCVALKWMTNKISHEKQWMLEFVEWTRAECGVRHRLIYCGVNQGGLAEWDMADLSHQEKTSSTSSGPEEHIAAINPVALPGVEGQEPAARPFGRLKREDPELEGGDGEDDRSKEPRSVTGEEQDDLATEEYPEDLHVEFEAWEAPCTSPGHA
ncbi:hypothetical protein NDU88_001621 [Pleurodeles waltl]|uniref:Uncharacterized protein n=1 Tax=Pleurodeles waltl TaxID=8319 RepID=A0AAV7SC40_PLEWA|nr:hypothetical protein NDU88_001621 [Pleurodeles waltl]